MHLQDIRTRAFAVLAGVLAVMLASCAKPPPPPPPPPPAPVVPMRPYPPQGASPNYVLPRLAPDGQRVTVNTGISESQMTWNLRAAFNVAALNCLRPQHVQILDGYKAFLTNHKRELLSTYKKVEADFKAKHGARQGLFERDVYMTQVYNHFAFPPTLMDFCDSVLAMSVESLAMKSDDLDEFAARKLPLLEGVFQGFYQRYDRYKVDLAHWDATYGALYGPRPVATTPVSGTPLSTTPFPVAQPGVVSAAPSAGSQAGLTLPEVKLAPATATP